MVPRSIETPQLTPLRRAKEQEQQLESQRLAQEKAQQEHLTKEIAGRLASSPLGDNLGVWPSVALSR